MVKKRQGPTIGVRLSADEKNILDAYRDATGQTRSKVFHELFKAAISKMAGVIVRADIARDLADPHVGDWTNTLPDAALDKAKGEQRRAAQKKA
jgi:predicted DNA-binding protein